MIGDRYSLDREIGRGGMGAVWLGRDEVLGRLVALKRVGMAPGGSGPDLARAEREARIAASLNHPNIVGVFDLVEDEEQQYIVMEYVEGVTLAELVRTRGALPPQQAARIMAQVASALAAAHASQVVHRDVKPSNILVRDDGHVKLSDFGIARNEADASLTQTGLVTGSPAYLSPEVASGRQATSASDVWSLGATLFHALAGRPPYDVGSNVLGALYQIVNEPPPRLQDAGQMGPVLLATMAQDPDQRWATTDVADALERMAVGAYEVPLPAPRTTSVPVVDSTQVLRPLQGTAGAPVHEPVPGPATGSVVGAPLTSGPVPEALASSTVVQPTEPVPPRPPSRRRPRRAAPIVVAALVLALLGAIVLLALMDDPQPTSSNPVADPTRSAPSRPTSKPTAKRSTTPTPITAQDIERFVADYLDTASNDPAAGFAQLTAGFQAESGGLDGYTSFWGEVSDTRLLSVQADPADLTVTYTYEYTVEGGGPQTDSPRLRLVRDGDQLLIAGEA